MKKSLLIFALILFPAICFAQEGKKRSLSNEDFGPPAATSSAATSSSSANTEAGESLIYRSLQLHFNEWDLVGEIGDGDKKIYLRRHNQDGQLYFGIGLGTQYSKAIWLCEAKQLAQVAALFKKLTTSSGFNGGSVKGCFATDPFPLDIKRSSDDVTFTYGDPENGGALNKYQLTYFQDLLNKALATK
jgi:hypothetical protein